MRSPFSLPQLVLFVFTVGLLVALVQLGILMTLRTREYVARAQADNFMAAS